MALFERGLELMTTLVKMKFGSHLYGTNTPASDLDIKAVHIPSAEGILLQRGKAVVSNKTKADKLSKNTSEDVDYESYTLHKYLALVSEGQTVALDMLFAPAFAWQEDPHPLWHEIRANRHRLLTKQYLSFVDYCRTQANKYGIKGSRIAAARQALACMDAGVIAYGTTAKLREVAQTIEQLIQLNPDTMWLLDRENPGGVTIRHWVVCGRQLPYTITIKESQCVMKKLVDGYGARALRAETNQGVDWKALSHAVRIGRQAIEVLTTGNVIFPRIDAVHLLAIKTGQLPYKAVSEEIETLLSQIEIEAERSTLPDKPDYEWIDAFVIRAYRAEVLDLKEPVYA